MPGFSQKLEGMRHHLQRRTGEDRQWDERVQADIDVDRWPARVEQDLNALNAGVYDAYRVQDVLLLFQADEPTQLLGVVLQAGEGAGREQRRREHIRPGLSRRPQPS